MGADFVAFPTFGGMFGKQKVDFLIIGAQKCGTSSLYQYVCENLVINSASKKEIHFFDFHYKKANKWYHGHFNFKRGKIAGEATPNYIFQPDVAKNVFDYNSKLKIIAILRNPIERAVSQFLMNRERGIEELSFSEAIRAEEGRTKHANQNIPNNDFQNFSYKKRGKYFEQLERWKSLFPKGQIMVINYSLFFQNPWYEVQKIYDFLEVPAYFGSTTNFHSNRSESKIVVNQKDLEYLNQYFKKPNELLSQHYSINFE